MMATTYKAPDYDEKKYRAGINTDYYTNAVDAYKNQQEQNRATGNGLGKPSSCIRICTRNWLI